MQVCASWAVVSEYYGRGLLDMDLSQPQILYLNVVYLLGHIDKNCMAKVSNYFHYLLAGVSENIFRLI